MPKYVGTDFNGIALLARSETTRYCPTCFAWTHPYEDAYDSKKVPDTDLSSSPEGLKVVSQRCMQFFDKVGVKDLWTKTLTSGASLLLPKESIDVDLRGSELDTSENCKTCGRQPDFLSNGAPHKLLVGQRTVPQMGLLRTRQVFGSENELFFHLVIGDELASLIENEKLTGFKMYEISQPCQQRPFMENFDEW